MANQPCTTCGGCCVTVCEEFVSPRCPCCDATSSLTQAPNQTFRAGQAVATNANGNLVYYNPNANPSDLSESSNFVGFTWTHSETDANGKLVSKGTNHPLAGNPCPKNRVMFYKCGIFKVSLIQGYKDLSGLDIARAIVALGYGRFEPNGNNPKGELKLY